MMTRIALALALFSTVAHAQSSPPDAPRPGDESGRLDQEPGDSALRKLARGVLYAPRLAVTLAFAPIEGGAWVYERYQLSDRASTLFFDKTGTYGLFPTFTIESGFSPNVGARFVHRNVGGAREHFDLRASTGGRFHEKAETSFRTGDRLGRNTALELGAEYQRRPRDSFYGIGNLDDAETMRVRYRRRLMRVTTAADRRLAGDLHLRAAAQVADNELMDTRARSAYGEIELRYDSRRNASMWEPSPVPATGWLIAGFGGRSAALDGGTDFWRYGADVQRFFYVGPGPRVIALRARGEAIAGETGEVPFVELPRIGGGTTLRGYAVDRFRDRVAFSSSIAYQWDIARYVSVSVFADAGKVAPTLRDVDTDNIRFGYGIAVDAHTMRSFLARATLASSVDGGVFFNVSLDPVFELQGRTERR